MNDATNTELASRSRMIDRIIELESALASERAKRDAAELALAVAQEVGEQAYTLGYTTSGRSVSGYLRRWLDLPPVGDRSAFDAALAEARAEAQKEMLAWLDLRIDAEELDMAAEIFGVDITWANRPARAAQIRKTQK